MRTLVEWSFCAFARRVLFAVFVMTALLAAVPGKAAPIHYNISFTGGSSNPTSGSFDYDPAAPAFSNFIVVWDGISFDLTFEANNPLTPGGSKFSTSCGVSGAALSFALMSLDVCVTTNSTTPNTPDWRGGAFEAVGTVSATFVFEAAFDEPGAIPDNQLLISGTEVVPSATQTGLIARGEWTITAASVPEPATLALLAFGLAGLGFSRRKKE